MKEKNLLNIIIINLKLSILEIKKNLERRAKNA